MNSDNIYLREVYESLKKTHSEVFEKLNSNQPPNQDSYNQSSFQNEFQVHQNFNQPSNINQNNIIIVNKSNYSSSQNRIYQKFRNVNDSHDEDDDKLLDLKSLFLIEIYSKFYIAWQYFMFVIVVYSAFISPIYLAFNYKNEVYKIFEILIEIFMISDIFLSLNTHIIDNNQTIISSCNFISYSYLKGWFCIDTICCFPASVIQIISHEIAILGYLRWISLLARVVKILKYQFIIKKSIFENEKLDNLCKKFVFFIIMLNVLSCFFIFIGLNNSDTNNWIVFNNVDLNHYISIYVASLFFHLMTFSTIGFGGIEGISIGEKIYSICLFILVILLFPYIVVSISKLFSDNESSDKIIDSELTKLLKKQKKLKFGKNQIKFSQELKMKNQKKIDERINFFDYLPYP